MKDLEKYKDAAHTFEKYPQYFKEYVPMVNKAMSKFFTVDGTPKREKQKQIMKGVYGKRNIQSNSGYLSCLEGGEIMSTTNIEEKQYLTSV